MKFKIDQSNYDGSVREYFEDYFKAKRDASEPFEASEIHIYEKRPREGSLKSVELKGEELRNRLKSRKPVFVIYGDDRSNAAAFREHDGMIYSGNDLVKLNEREDNRQMTTVKPQETEEPGAFSKMLYNVFHYKTGSYQAFEEYKVKKEEFQLAIDLEQSRIVSGMIAAEEERIAREFPERSRAGLVKKAKTEQERPAQKTVTAANPERKRKEITEVRKIHTEKKRNRSTAAG